MSEALNQFRGTRIWRQAPRHRSRTLARGRSPPTTNLRHRAKLPRCRSVRMSKKRSPSYDDGNATDSPWLVHSVHLALKCSAARRDGWVELMSTRQSSVFYLVSAISAKSPVSRHACFYETRARDRDISLGQISWNAMRPYLGKMLRAGSRTSHLLHQRNFAAVLSSGRRLVAAKRVGWIEATKPHGCLFR